MNQTAPNIQSRSAIGELFSAIAVEGRWLLADTAVMTWRNLIRYRRSPELLMFSTLSPVMFVLLFNYVFGGAIPTGDLNYIDYLMPGILVQTTIFSATQTGVGLAEDLQKGMVDRYRSLPMARSAVLGGRVVAETLVSIFVACLMLTVGLIIGMRFHGDFWPGFATPFMVAGFAFGFSWVAALVGASVRNAESAGSLMFFVVFPLTFLSIRLRPHRIHARLASSLRRHQPRHKSRRPRPSPNPRRSNHPQRPGNRRLDNRHGSRHRTYRRLEISQGLNAKHPLSLDGIGLEPEPDLIGGEGDRAGQIFPHEWGKCPKDKWGHLQLRNR